MESGSCQGLLASLAACNSLVGVLLSSDPECLHVTLAVCIEQETHTDLTRVVSVSFGSNTYEVFKEIVQPLSVLRARAFVIVPHVLATRVTPSARVCQIGRAVNRSLPCCPARLGQSFHIFVLRVNFSESSWLLLR